MTGLLVKIIELLTDKTDERKTMRIYGVHGLTQQYFSTLKNQMPMAVDWVVYAISCLYD